jgi:hypothetical protein
MSESLASLSSPAAPLLLPESSELSPAMSFPLSELSELTPAASFPLRCLLLRDDPGNSLSVFPVSEFLGTAGDFAEELPVEVRK